MNSFKRCPLCGWKMRVEEEICPKCGDIQIPGMEISENETNVNIGQPNSQPLENGTTFKYKTCFKDSIDICITINGVKQISPAFILYYGTKYKGNQIIEVEIAELFIASRDTRGLDGRARIPFRPPRCNDGQVEIQFYDYILERESHAPWMIRQILEFYSDEYGLSEDFVIANGTRYYIKEIAKSQVSNVVNDKIDKSNKFCNLIAKLCLKLKNKLCFHF